MKSRQMALCGLMTALSVVLMLLTGITGIGTFAGPILAMAAVLPVLEECGRRSALTVYAAAAILSLLLVPDMEQALLFAGFGWYPVLRPHMARISSRLLRLLLRVALCTAVIFLVYGSMLYVLGVPAELLLGEAWLNALLVVLGNLLFLMTDAVLARLTVLWRYRLRRRFFKG